MKKCFLKHKEAITIKVRMATNGSSCAWDGPTEQLWHARTVLFYTLTYMVLSFNNSLSYASGMCVLLDFIIKLILLFKKFIK